MKINANLSEVAVAATLAGILSLGMPDLCSADAPGGFVEFDSSTAVRPMLTQSQITGFVPSSRGSFSFPAPYNTQGLRVTQSSDCGGQDCVDMTYSYWRNMSNSAGSNTMYILVGLDKNRGGAGPTLFSYDKVTGAVTDMGALFPANSSYAGHSTEGMYFSYSLPTKIYLIDGTRLLRFDVLTHAFETVFDVSSQYPNTVLHQANSSDNDDVHSATLEDSSSYNALGCVVYRASTSQYFFFPVQGNFDECQIDKSGRYIEIKEKLPIDTCSSCDEDDVFIDLQTGAQTILLDMNGAGGHSDLGYGYMLAADNWNRKPNAWRLWNMAVNPVASLPLGVGNLHQGALMYYGASWGIDAPSHMSFENAVSASIEPVNSQYACGAGANAVNGPRANEVICFPLDGSGRVLVVAPVMTDENATGGDATCPNCTSYAKDPKGNIDPTGQYFFWVSNCAGPRMDAFIVKLPYQLLTSGVVAPPPPSPPPTGLPLVAITSPGNDATLSGTVTVAVKVSGAQAISNVTVELDGGAREVTLDAPPYSVSWDTSDASSGRHVLTAIAVDSAGDTGTSAPVTVFVSARPRNGWGGGGSPPPSSSQQSGAQTIGGGVLGLGELSLLWLLLASKRRRRSVH
ncbi:MAG: Ig-like domain-containing protein [Bacillota bacterium]